jgi:hypothetical protein
MQEPTEKPTMVFRHENAFATIGAASKALRKAGADKEYIDQYTEEAMSGDHDNLIAVTMQYVNPE